MNELKKKIKEQIDSLKQEITKITNQIESQRDEGDEDNVGISGELQDRLDILTERIDILRKNLSIYQTSASSDDISVGHTIAIQKDQLHKQITIVLPDDADPVSGLISTESPLGQALIGKRVGETVHFETPAGLSKFEIKQIVK